MLNILVKTNDEFASCLDHKSLGIREELTLFEDQTLLFLPLLCYNLTRKEKEAFCDCLEGIKLPNGYSLNIRTYDYMGQSLMIVTPWSNEFYWF